MAEAFYWLSLYDFKKVTIFPMGTAIGNGTA